MANSQVWIVRAGVNNEIASNVKEASVVAIGWDAMGDLTGMSTRDDFKNLYRSKYPDGNEARVGIGAGQAYKFVQQIEKGDFVLTPIAVSR